MSAITAQDIMATHGALLPRAAVAKITGRCADSLHYAIKAGEFPPPVNVGFAGRKSLRWRATDIAAWINSRPVAA